MLNRIIRAATAALVALAAYSSTLYAQDTESQSALFIEMGGSGLLYSINYEGRFTDHTSARLGLTFVNQTITNTETGIESTVAVTLMPIMGNVLLGNGKSRLELGAGPLVAIAGSSANRVDAAWAHVDFEHISIAGVTSAIGYRYQPASGMMFRATLTPFYSSKPQVWAGVSVGWAL
jgi:hypothetical protein